MVNKFHFLNGGAELYYFGLSDLLARHGHHVGHFSMEHPRNVSSPYARHFVANVDYSNAAGILNRAKIALKTVYSVEARRKITALLREEQFDIAHLVNFHHQITPSILPALRARGTKIVYVVQDLKPVCGNYKMLTHDGVCERCKGGKFYQQTLNKCTKNSVFASAVNSVEMYVHHWMGYYHLIDSFITPSEFYRTKLIEFGMPAEKISTLPNFIDVESYSPQFCPGDYLLYLGRLSEEKGVPTLIEAMKGVPELHCKIAGTGPFEAEVKQRLQAANCANVELLGHIDGERLQHELRNCMALVVPSEWYEAFGLCTVEAYACGKPVIGARIGGITETIVEGKTGWLFESGNVSDLVRAIREMLDSRDSLEALGRQARQHVLEHYDAKAQYAPVTQLYSRLLSQR